MTGSSKKELGQYVTPKNIVDIILDSVGYMGEAVLSARIFEPCFGSGVFLVKIAERIIAEGLAAGISSREIADIIQSNVCGIEKDKALYGRAVVRLNNYLRSHNIPLPEWSNLINGDTLLLYKNYRDMDFVVGNPPFVRIHDIPLEYRELAKSFRFSSKGMLDMYIIFYEIGMNMLKPNTGRLGYISPNSFLRNSSQQGFRDFLIANRYISAVYDFKDSRVFENADTYTCICILSKASSDNCEVKCGSYQMDEMSGEYAIPFGEFCEAFQGKAWNLHSIKDMMFLKENERLDFRLGDISDIQNGVTTQADSIYVGRAFLDYDCSAPYIWKGEMDARIRKEPVYFQNGRGEVVPVEAAALHRCVKGSRFAGVLDNDYIVFPYDKGGQNGYSPLTEKALKDRYPLAYEYLLSEKGRLLARDRDKNADWFLFGRSQGLRNSNMKKIVFKNFIGKHAAQIVPYILDEDVIVYSGIYMVQNTETYTLESLCKIVSSEDFIRYIKLTGKNLSGGYVYIGTKQAQGFGVACTRYCADKSA